VLFDLAHRPAQLAIGENRVALEADFIDTDLTAFIELEDHARRAVANLFCIVLDDAVAQALVIHQLLDDAPDLVDFLEVERRVDRDVDPFFLQLIGNRGLGDAVGAAVIDLGDDRQFDQDKGNDLALLAVRDSRAEVLEEPGLPKRTQIARDPHRIEVVAWFRGNAIENRVVCDAVIPL
jgi:hypothetical protein